MTRDKEKLKAQKRRYREKHKKELAEYNHKYYADPVHKAQRNEWQREWSKNNPERQKGIKLKYRYGISIDEYNIIFNIQNGKCKICHIHQSELKKPLYVDHSHNNGVIRGLICQRCNSALGMFDDDIEKLQEAINYLKGE